MIYHQPVLVKELIAYLKPKVHQKFIDATIGLGGHTKAIIEKTGKSVKVLGIDYDKRALNEVRRKKLEGVVLHLGNFKNLKEIAKKNGFFKVDGVIFDLGLGSWQIEDEDYGLSFQKDAPLSMQIQAESSQLKASEIVNRWPKEELTKIFREYGDVKRPWQIAEKIIQSREKKPIENTLQLVKAIGVKNPKVLAKIFQALRIAVNDEFGNLKKALPQALELLSKGGKIAIISYHSGEDRIVKNFFRSKPELKILTKKPVVPSEEEIKENPKARSAKLRVAQKIEK